MFRIGLARNRGIMQAPIERTLRGPETAFLLIDDEREGMHAAVVGLAGVETRPCQLILRPELNGRPIMIADPSGSVVPYEEALPTAYPGGGLVFHLIGGDMERGERIRIAFKIFTGDRSNGQINVETAMGAVPAVVPAGTAVIDINAKAVIAAAKAAALPIHPAAGGGGIVMSLI